MAGFGEERLQLCQEFQPAAGIPARHALAGVEDDSVEHFNQVRRRAERLVLRRPVEDVDHLIVNLPGRRRPGVRHVTKNRSDERRQVLQRRRGRLIPSGRSRARGAGRTGDFRREHPGRRPCREERPWVAPGGRAHSADSGGSVVKDEPRETSWRTFPSGLPVTDWPAARATMTSRMPASGCVGSWRSWKNTGSVCCTGGQMPVLTTGAGSGGAFTWSAPQRADSRPAARPKAPRAARSSHQDRSERRGMRQTPVRTDRFGKTKGARRLVQTNRRGESNHDVLVRVPNASRQDRSRPSLAPAHAHGSFRSGAAEPIRTCPYLY